MEPRSEQGTREHDERRALARCLCGDPAAWTGSPEALLEAARRHRVQFWLAGALDPRDPVAATLSAALSDEYRHAAVVEALQTRAARDLLAAAQACGAAPLVYKGAALAHPVYTRPWERPRSDLDLLVHDREVPAMRRALEAAGYAPMPEVDGDLVTGQFHYTKTVAPGVVDQVDVHTRLFNPVAFAAVLDAGTAHAASVALPALGPTARTFSPPHALLAACVHPVAHHYGAADLIWLLDVDLLARQLGAGGWERFVAAAATGRVRQVCGATLAATAALFETPIPAAVMTRLRAAGDEPSVAYLARHLDELEVQLLNFRQLTGWRARGALVRQHLFPPQAYVRELYGVRSGWLLPWCYAHRVCVGVPRWLIERASARR